MNATIIPILPASLIPVVDVDDLASAFEIYEDITTPPTWPLAPDFVDDLPDTDPVQLVADLLHITGDESCNLFARMMAWYAAAKDHPDIMAYWNSLADGELEIITAAAASVVIIRFDLPLVSEFHIPALRAYLGLVPPSHNM